MRNYYVLSSCDEWKSYSSFKLIGVFSPKKLRLIIKSRIRQGQFKFNSDINDIDSMDIDHIERSLEYGCIQEIVLNQAV